MSGCNDNMQYAINADGNKISIDDVAHGSATYTKCKCMYCGRPVGANKNFGKKYFYHQ